MPDRSNQTAANRGVLDALREHGDALTTPREVDHFAYFPTREGQTRFVDGCLAAGFKLRSTREPDDMIDRFGVIVWHVDVPEEEASDKVTGFLINLAEQAGGEYDGWETQVLR